MKHEKIFKENFLCLRNPQKLQSNFWGIRKIPKGFSSIFSKRKFQRSENIAKGMLNFNNKYLILRCNFNCRDKAYNGKWELPGGRIENENPDEAIIREVEEETGIKAEIYKKVGIFKVKQDSKIINCHLYLLKCFTDKIRIADEHIDYKWIKPEELKKYEIVYLLANLKEIFIEQANKL